MKEHESDVSQDLDAGWDEIEADVTSVSVKTKVAEELVEVADLDAGWDFAEPKPQVRRSKQKDKDGAKKPDPQKGNQAVPVNPESIAAPALTKRARRELDRLNQIHASKRKSEAKVLRKQQRLAKNLAPAEPSPLSTADPARPVSAPNPNRIKKSVPKRRKLSQPQPELQPKSRTSARRESDTSTYPENSKPISDSRNVSTVESQSAQVGNWRWWALGIALVIVLWVAARWIFTRGR